MSPLIIITAIRESFMDARMVYVYGGCYGFHKILKAVYPTATAYESDELDFNHVITRIKGVYYDIDGEISPEGYTLVTRARHTKWESNSFGQRVELMLAKYQRYCHRMKGDRL